MRKEWMNPDRLDFKNISDFVLYIRHKKAYDFVKDEIKDKKILEIGCGSGFGSNILSEYAKDVYAIDIDRDAIEKAKENNKKGNIRFYNIDVLKGLPFEQNSFESVVCFQVFEHIDPQKTKHFLSEIARILKNSGKLFLTTPNRKIRLLFFQKPLNKYHKKEYSAKSLRKSLERVFAQVSVYGLRARKDIEEIEYQRAKQNYFYTFIKRPIKNLLPEKMKNKLDRKIIPDKKNPRKKSTNVDMNNITTGDFYLSEKDMDKSLDLYAICIKRDDVS